MRPRLLLVDLHLLWAAWRDGARGCSGSRSAQVQLTTACTATGHFHYESHCITCKQGRAVRDVRQALSCTPADAGGHAAGLLPSGAFIGTQAE